MAFSGSTGSTHGITLKITPTSSATANARKYESLPMRWPKIVKPAAAAGCVDADVAVDPTGTSFDHTDGSNDWNRSAFAGCTACPAGTIDVSTFHAGDS